MARQLDGVHHPSDARLLFEQIVIKHPIATGTAVLISFFIVVGIAWATYAFLPIIPTSIATAEPVVDTSSPAPGTIEPVLAAPTEPKTISAATIALNAAIQPVGLTKRGAMAVPSNTNETGWFNLGYKPGQVGNAVITGHLDTFWMNPAVFARIDRLNVGDEITVTDTNNTAWRFIVSNIAKYPHTSLPLEEIFGSSDKAHLNLITCSGKWSWKIASYTERTVVYSELSQL